MSRTHPRVPEAQALLNPAFGAYLLACGVHAANRAEAHRPLPWPAAFLVLPLVLPEDTRQALPARTSRSLAAWLADHPQQRALFPDRAAALTPYTRASMRTALRHQVLQITGQGLRCPRAPRKAAPDNGTEVADCAKKAAIIGRWLAAVDLATAFRLLGVRP